MFGRCPVGGFKYGALIADIGSWPHPQTANNRGGGIGEVVPI